MIYLAYAYAALCVVVFGLYFHRMLTLGFRFHEWTFVVQNILSGIVCAYSAYAIVDTGSVHPLAVIAPLTAALYLFRSRDTYVEAKHSAPAPLNALGGRTRVFR